MQGQMLYKCTASFDAGQDWTRLLVCLRSSSGCSGLRLEAAGECDA